jgi:hypothetical protein
MTCPKQCGNCCNPIRRSRTGLCRSCAAKAFLADPANLARRTERLRAILCDPARQPQLHAQRVQASRSRWQWCPLEYRAAYRHLCDVKKVRAADARLMITDMIAVDAARYARSGQLQHSRRAA